MWVTGDHLILLRWQCSLPFSRNEAFPRMPFQFYLLPKLSVEVGFEDPASLKAGLHPMDTGSTAPQLADKGGKMDFWEAWWHRSPILS